MSVRYPNSGVKFIFEYRASGARVGDELIPSSCELVPLEPLELLGGRQRDSRKTPLSPAKLRRGRRAGATRETLLDLAETLDRSRASGTLIFSRNGLMERFLALPGARVHAHNNNAWIA